MKASRLPAFFAPLFATGLHAANITWDTAGLSNTWDINTTTNWTGDATVFNTGDAALFDAATGETVSVVAGGVTPASTTISGNGAWTLNGASILGGTLAKSGTGALTLSNTGGNSFSGITLTGTGAGTGLYNSTNGSLKFANGNVLGSGIIDFSAVSNVSTGFYATTTTTVTNDIVIPTSFGWGVTHLTGNTTTFSGVISGGSAANSVALGAATTSNPTSVTKLTNASNSFKGTIYLGRGVLAITSNGALGDAANLIYLDQGSTNGQLRFDANNIDVTHNIRQNTSSKYNVNGYDATLSGTIQAFNGAMGVMGGTLSVGNSSGSLTITGSNLSASAYTISVDTKFIAASVNALGGGAKTVSAGATVAFKNVGTYTSAGIINLNGSGTQLASVGVGALENIAGSNIFNNNVVLQSASTIGTTAGSLTLGGNVTGAFALTKVGSGKLTLSGTSGFTDLNINAGTLATGSATAIGSGLVSMANSTTLESSAVAPVAVAGGLTIGTTGTDTNTLNFVGTDGYLNVSGSTTINSGAGNVTINLLGAAPAIGQYPMLDYSGSLGGTGYPAFTLGSLPNRVIANLVNNVANTSVDINVTGVDFPVWSGAQSSEWSTNAITAPKNWVLNSNNLTTTDFLVGDTVVFNSFATGTTVDISNGDVSPGTTTFDNKNFTLTGINGIAGSGSLIKSGTGTTLTIANTNSYTGGTTITSGTLQLGDGVTNGVVAGTIVNNATLKFNNGTTQTFSASISGTGVVTNQGNNDLTLAGNLTDTLSLAKIGAGNLTLSGLNNYSGGTTVSVGTLTGTTTSIQGNITNNASVVFDQSSAGTYAGTMTGTGILTKSGAGSLTLSSGTNDYSGGTTILAGPAQADGANTSAAIHVAASNVLGTGPVAMMNTTSTSLLRFVTDGAELPNAVSLSTTPGLINEVNVNQNMTGVLSGKISGGEATSSLFIDSSTTSASSSLRLTNATNDFVVSKITLWRGNLGITSDGALGNAGNDIEHYTESVNGALRFDADNIVLNSLRTINLPGPNNSRPFNTQAFTATIAGPITGTGAIVKQGAGKLILSSNSNSQTGSITVSDGTLQVDGNVASSASLVAVSSTGTLGGNGSILRNVTVNGAIAPGASVGTLSITGTTTINGTFAEQIDGATKDLLVVTGDLALGAASILNVTELNPATTFPYVIATYSGTRTGTFASVTPGYTVDYGTANTILLKQGTAYDSWAALKGLDGTLGKEKGLNDDPDGDGLDNVIEFVLDNDPLSGTNANPPTVTASGSDLVFTYTRRDDSEYLNPFVEFDADLVAPWTVAVDPGNATIAVAENSSNPDLVTVTIPKGANPKLFARVNVTVP